MAAPLDLTGKLAGRLKVLKLDTKRTATTGLRFWVCRCRCGTKTSVRACHLVSGATRSCGCLQREIATKTVKPNRIDLTGRRFGRLKVLQFDAKQSAGPTQGRRRRYRFWVCRCRCGTKTSVRGSRLIAGRVRSCGCLVKERGRGRGLLSPSETLRAYKDAEVKSYLGKTYYSLAKAMSFARVASMTLYLWANLVRSRKGRPGCCWLGGQAIEAVRLPGAMGRKYWYFSEHDLTRVNDARRRPPRTPDGSRVCAKEIGRRLGLTGLYDAMSLAAVLRHWRQTGDLAFEVGDVPARNGVRLYDIDRVKALIAGRIVRRLAKELRETGAIASPVANPGGPATDDRVGNGSTTTAMPLPECGPDCCWVRWPSGAVFHFTPTMAKAVQVLMEDHRRQAPGTTAQAICAAIGRPDAKVPTIFLMMASGERVQHPAWGTMIVRVQKGLYAVKDPNHT